MDQNYNNSQNEFLWTLLANPAGDAHLHNYNLQRLVNDFPQSGILQALLAHSSDEKNLRQASVYFNAKSLYKLINAPSTFIGVSDEKIIVQPNLRLPGFNGVQHQQVDTVAGENYFSDHTTAQTENGPAVIADHQPAIAHEVVQPLTDELHAAEHQTPVPAEETHESLVSEIKDEVLSQIPFVHHDAAPAEEIHESIQEASNAAAEKPEGWLAEIKGEVASQIPFVHHDAAPAEEVHENIQETSNAAAEKPEGWLAEIKDEVLNHIPFVHHSTEPAEEAHESTQEANNHVEEKHEGWGAEIKDEIIKDVPYAAPIINYASGMGHRMPPDPEVTAANPAETPAETTAHETVPTAKEEAAPETPIVSAHTEAPAENVTAEVPAQEHKHEEAEPVSHFAAENNIAEPVQQPKHEEAVHEHLAHQPEAKSETTSHNIEEETFDEFNGNIAVEPDIISNIAATDYFMFDRAFGIHKAEEEPVTEPAQPPTAAKHEAVNEQSGNAEQQDVSNYNDEKLPYSFLWWLDKTRKEHSGIYQPYVAPEKENPVRAKSKPGTDELQQQYYENIFHITSVEELDKSVPAPLFTPAGFEPKNTKEHTIIERFIQEEPQIRPQSSDKLDNENKAKKSSEDRDELVSETLAAIYSDQMLYHKAIASYKKLMLKFPEKSRYFAAKIEQLEKKTN